VILYLASQILMMEISRFQSGEKKVSSAKINAKTCALPAPEPLISHLRPSHRSRKKKKKEEKLMRGVGFEPTRENPIRMSCQGMTLLWILSI
jgi:hypothetical protein